jgi:hypothetical protein
MPEHETGARRGILAPQSVSSDEATATFPALLPEPALPSVNRGAAEREPPAASLRASTDYLDCERVRGAHRCGRRCPGRDVE